MLLAVLLTGCVPAPGGGTVRPKPTPDSGIAAAAEKSARDYDNGLAEVSDSIANRIESGELNSHAAVFDAFNSTSAATRAKAMKPYTDAVTERLKPAQVTFDKAAAVEAFRESAKGFREAAK